MLSNTQKNIIVRALRIRQEDGEKPEEILKGYTKLSEKERAEILKEVSELQILYTCEREIKKERGKFKSTSFFLNPFTF